MATEKILIFDEAGNAKRMKVRIARFLDNEPVTASDKTNIRTTLDVDDSLSGTFTTPLSVTSASDSSFTGGGKLHISESSGATIRLESTTPTLQTGGVLGAIEFETQDAGSEGVNAKINSVFENTVGATSLQFFTSEAFTTVPAAPRWTINSTGNLVAGANLGIDFGSAATSAGQGAGTTGSVSNSVLSDYEFGSWVPRFEMTGANFAALTMDVIAAQYCKVGRHVHCQAYIRTDNVDTTGASGTVAVQGLPFVSDASSGNHTPLSVGYSAAWVNAPTAGYVQPNATYVYLTRNGTTGTSVIGASDVTNGASADKNELIFSVSYIAST
jgi:hypothetical protein